MTERDLNMYIKKADHYVDLSFTEDGEDITDTVTEVRMYLTDGLVSGFDVFFVDGSEWGGHTIPLK